MRAAGPAILVFCVLTTGCGYVGPVVPPSPNIPRDMTDLAVIERGDRLIVTGSTPVYTTDGLLIKKPLEDVQLDIGPDVKPFDFGKWSAAAKHYELPAAAAPDPDDPKPMPLTHTVPVSDFPAGEQIAVAIRTAAKGDRFSQWSNVVHLEVEPPLDPPVATATATAEGIKLTWNEQRPGLHFRVTRKGPADKDPVDIGTAEKGEFVDVRSEFDTPYTYTVTAQHLSAESLPAVSQPNPMIAKDTFPPSVPSAVTALASASAIELTWERSPESDLKGYYVFRSVDGKAFERQGELVGVPSYSDHNVEHGKTYRYRISAIDQHGNESAQSAPPVDVTF